MTAKFVSRNGETFRILYQTDDAVWLISVDSPTEKPFRIALPEPESFERVATP